MKDEKYTPEVGMWLKGREVAPRDSQDTARQVADRLPYIRQRSRWWPYPLFYRRSNSASTTDTTEYQPSPIPAPNGHTPTVTGRTQSMFSPVKAVTAGALVFAIGGVMLIAQPFDQQAGSVPGAETEAIAPTWVTGNTQHLDGSCSQVDIERVGDASRSRYECTAAWTSSDPRLTGDSSRRWNTDTYQTQEGAVEVSTEVHYLRNDDGGWACSNRYLGKDSIPATDVLTDYTLTCIGNGGYEGLSAVLQSTAGEDFSEAFVGLIFSGDGPPLPEAPAAE